MTVPGILRACCLALLAMSAGGDGGAVPWQGVARNGTGFVVDEEGRVVTNHHLVAGCRGVMVRRGNARIGASLVAADRGVDLALLAPHGALPSRPVAFRSNAGTRAGERVVVAGFPREVSGTGWLRAGSADVGMVEDRDGRFRISVPVAPGNSGGPVFDRSARVIGVAAGTLRDGSTGAPVANPGVVIGAETVKDFLRFAGVNYRLGEGTALGIRAIADRASDSTVLVECL